MNEPVTRDVIVEVIGAATAALERQLGERFDGLRRHLDEKLLEIGADLDLALDRLDRFETSLGETKALVTKISRERFRDVRREQAATDRIEAIERRLAALEKGTTP